MVDANSGVMALKEIRVVLPFLNCAVHPCTAFIPEQYMILETADRTPLDQTNPSPLNVERNIALKFSRHGDS